MNSLERVTIEQKVLTAITGPMRSGTSCLTGLLELCGFDLGKNVRILRNSTEFNPRGHFETDLLFTINKRLLEEVPGSLSSIFTLSDQEALTALAAEREKYFRLFIEKFDGNLFKDPLLCITYHLWEKRWPQLNRVIFCLRNPLSVAQSMQKRYKFSLDYGFTVWLTYVNRFFESEKQSRLYIFDFDAFVKNPTSSLASLLDWLDSPVPNTQIQTYINAFYEQQLHSNRCRNKLGISIPAAVQDRYLELVVQVSKQTK